MAGFINQLVQQPQQQQQQMAPAGAPPGFAPQAAAPGGFPQQGPQQGFGGNGGFVQQAPPNAAPHSPGFQQQAPQQAPQAQNGQPTIVRGQDGQPYVQVGPNQYVPLAQYQQMQQQPQTQQQQAPNFAPQTQQQQAPMQQQMQQAPMQQNGFNGQQGFNGQSGFNGQQNGFNGQQAPQNGFNGGGFPAQQNGGGQAPVGGFANGGMPWGGQQQQPAQPAMNYEAYMSGMEGVAADAGGRTFFRGDGVHIVRILGVECGVGKTSLLPFFSVHCEILQSTSQNNPPGYQPSWTDAVKEGKMLEKHKGRVKGFLKVALAATGQNVPDAQITGQTSAWAGSAAQPLKGLILMVTTRERPPGEKSRTGNPFTEHSWALAPPNMVQHPQRLNG